MEIEARKFSLYSVFLTFFLDGIGFAIVFPIFAPFFLDIHNSIFSADVAVTTRTAYLGFFLSAYSLAQFFGAPLLGEFADISGRKKALIVSVFLTLCGYLLSGWSIYHKHLPFLFFSRIITGFFSGNLSVCFAAVGDLSRTEKEKIHLFGYLAALGGFSFTAGVFLGGKLSDSSLQSFFDFSFPFWVSSGLTALNLFAIIFFFRETIEKPHFTRFDLWEGIRNIYQALKIPKVKIFYLIYFFFVFAWTILFQFTPVKVIELYRFSNSQIGDLAAFMGICWIVGAGIINKYLVKRFDPLRVLEANLLIFSSCLLIYAFVHRLSGVVLLLGICMVCVGILWPLCYAIISNLSPQRMQGKILGTSQSMASLAMAFSPLLGGFVDAFHSSAAFILAGIISFIASWIYFLLKL